MRDVKFRAWDEEKKKMIVDGYINETTNYKLGVDISGGLIGFVDSPFQEYAVTRIAEKFVIMESTGLFDKNSREIYEGDIIEGVARTYVVEMTDGLCQECGKYRGWNVENPELVEVVGNIYENPELVEGIA